MTDTATADVRVVPVDLLDPSDHNRDIDPDGEDIRELAESIKQAGTVAPLLVEPVGDRYRVIDGGRRLVAARLAGVAELPAYVRTFANDHERDLAMLLANLHRRDWNPLDEAAQYARLLGPAADGSPGISQRKLSAQVGRSQAHISRRVALLDLPDVAKDKLRRGDINVKDAEALTFLLPHHDRIVDCLDPDVRWPSIRAAVDYHLQQLQLIERRNKVREELEAQGVTVVEQDSGRWPPGYAYTDNLNVDPATHEKAQCRVVGLLPNGNVVELCSDPARHRKGRRPQRHESTEGVPVPASPAPSSLLTLDDELAAVARTDDGELERQRALGTLVEGPGWTVGLDYDSNPEKPIVVTAEGSYSSSEARALADELRRLALRVEFG